jgi:hypothetical protein
VISSALRLGVTRETEEKTMRVIQESVGNPYFFAWFSCPTLMRATKDYGIPFTASSHVMTD